MARAVTFSGKWARLVLANGCHFIMEVSILREMAPSFIELTTSALSIAARRREFHPVFFVRLDTLFFFCLRLCLSLVISLPPSPSYALRLLLSWSLSRLSCRPQAPLIKSSPVSISPPTDEGWIHPTELSPSLWRPSRNRKSSSYRNMAMR